MFKAIKKFCGLCFFDSLTDLIWLPVPLTQRLSYVTPITFDFAPNPSIPTLNKQAWAHEGPFTIPITRDQLNLVGGALAQIAAHGEAPAMEPDVATPNAAPAQKKKKKRGFPF